MKNIITITVSKMEETDIPKKLVSFAFEETDTTRSKFHKNGVRSLIWLMSVIAKHLSMKAMKGVVEYESTN